MAEQHKSRGNEYFAANNWEQAVEEYTAAINLDGRNHVCVLVTCFPCHCAFVLLVSKAHSNDTLGAVVLGGSVWMCARMCMCVL